MAHHKVIQRQDCLLRKKQGTTPQKQVRPPRRSGQNKAATLRLRVAAAVKNLEFRSLACPLRQKDLGLASQLLCLLVFVTSASSLPSSAQLVEPSLTPPSPAIELPQGLQGSTAADLPDSPSGESSSRNDLLPVETPSTIQAKAAPAKWNWKASTLQAFEFTMFNHVWRAAWDPSLRYQLAHKPFFRDWFASYGGYNLHRWSDGDDFVVNYVGHPLQGAVTSRIYLQNDPRSFVPISKNRNYWIPLAWSTLWSAVWQVQWKVGPFSETSFGNAGGWEYVPGCGTPLSCLNNPKYPKPPTNNTGLTDWVSTPLIGDAWVLAEDTLDRYIVAPIARNHRIFGGRILRACLEPSRDFAALFAGKLVWQLPQYENNYSVSTLRHKKADSSRTSLPYDKWEIGTSYTNLSLPVLSNQCTGIACRRNLSGVGFNFNYNLTRWFGFDTAVNFMPGQQGSKAVTEGLLGVKMGERFRKWGVWGKIRPGFIYYQEAMPGGGVDTPESLTRFAWDFGGIVELYPARSTTWRFDVGTTLVRYLANYPDPRMSPINDLRSTQYYSNQGNLQVSTSYIYRF